MPFSPYAATHEPRRMQDTLVPAHHVADRRPTCDADVTGHAVRAESKVRDLGGEASPVSTAGHEQHVTWLKAAGHTSKGSGSSTHA